MERTWKLVYFEINPSKYFFEIEGHEALDINPAPGYNTLLLRLIPGVLYSRPTCPHRQFHTNTTRPFTQPSCTDKLLP